MLKAVDQNGTEILAYNKSNKQLDFIRHQPLYCPECQERVVLKAGPVKIPHFAHKNDVNCPNQKGEGEDHLNGKLALFHWVRNQGIPAKLEHSLPSIQQRIDLLVKYHHQWIALEYQCSPISTTELIKRTLGIASKNIYPIWIFGKKYYNSTHDKIKWNTTLRSSVIYFPKINQSKLFFYDASTQLMTIASDIYSNKSKSVAQITQRTLEQLSWRDLFQNKPIPRSLLYKKWFVDKKFFRHGQRKFVSNDDRDFLNDLYQRHLHPQFLPSCIYLPVKNSFRYLVPLYIWQTHIVLYIQNQPIGTVIKWFEIRQIINKYFKEPIESSYPSEAIHPAYHYLKILVQLGHLKQLNYSEFKKTKEFYFPKTLDDALKEDQILLKKLLKL